MVLREEIGIDHSSQESRKPNLMESALAHNKRSMGAQYNNDELQG
jgi:hypothetical protein